MGKTVFAGPIYGAKQTLLSVTASIAGSTGALALVRVPVGENWLLTDVSFGRLSTGLATNSIRVTDDSTVVSSVVLNSTAATSTSIAVTPDAGEYEGLSIAADSEVGVASAVSTATGVITVVLSGYRRFVSSSRSEG